MTSNTSSDPNAVPKIRKPTDSAFKQQRLPSWQPIITAGTVLPVFFIIGILFIPLGVVLVHFSDNIREKIVDYTYCNNTEGVTCASVLTADFSANCECVIQFKLEENFPGPVYMYYGLTNYYQNHRRYVSSRDDRQLLGRLSEYPSSDCVPFREDTFSGKPVAPCGAIANSMFSDSMKLAYVEDEQSKEVPLLRTGISWKTDRNSRFINPEGDLQKAFANFSKPVNWRKPVYQLDLEDPENNGFQNEDLIVWMRTAALPTFRKLYRRIDHSQGQFSRGLSKGTYELRVQYIYDVVVFRGTKRMILSTMSFMGGKNPFLGIMYIAFGGLCMLLGLVFLFLHIRFGQPSLDVSTTNPRTGY